MLASPQFLFRLESAPAGAAGRPVAIALGDIGAGVAPVVFLWGAAPDAELSKLAAQGRLSAPGVLEKQVARMLADPRSEALVDALCPRSGCGCSDVDEMLPDALVYPYFDHTLGDAFIKETELFFDSLVREDRSILDLLTADYTFVNERHRQALRHSERHRQRVPARDAAADRRGILGHGSMLMLTSVADRTSPVMRGKWVMEVLLGSPPPPPPPDVPAFEETKARAAGKLLTVRERMEEHRKNPACTSCHRVIDPLGLALDNFDVTGKWRIKDNGVPVDPTGDAVRRHADRRPGGLRAALLKHQDVFLLSFTENLMTYALGRRVEPLRHAGRAQDHPRRGEAQLQDVVVRAGPRRRARRSRNGQGRRCGHDDGRRRRRRSAA